MFDVLQPAERIHAAVYAHNQNYYKQPLFRRAVPARIHRNPAKSSYREAASEIAGLLEAADDVISASMQLRHPNLSGMLARTAEHDEPDAFEVSAGHGASLTEYRLRIDRLAQAQSNEGIAWSKSAPTPIRIGLNQIAIASEGRTTVISTLIFPDDTHGQTLAKWRNAINLSDVAVKATIVNDPATESAKLVLSATRPGKRYAFRVEDENGNAAEVLGIGSVKIAASDAAYAINGGAMQSSATNEIKLDDGKVTVRLKAPTTTDVQIVVLPDVSRAVREVKAMVEAYHSLYRRATDTSGYLNASVSRFVGQVIQGFETIGIVNRPDGTLALDEARLTEALHLRYEQTRKLVCDAGGLADLLSRIASRFAQVTPSSLLNAGMRELQSYAAYRPPEGHYLQIPMTGLLHDGEL